MTHGLLVAGALTTLGCSGHSASIVEGTSGGTSGSTSGGGSGSPSGTPPSSAVEALFEPPTGQASPDSIYGVWGGTNKSGGITFDSRMKLAKDSATLGTRCTLDSSGKVSSIVGVTAAARISDESLVILESKSDEKNDGGVRCRVSATPREVRRCEADVANGFERNCFKLEGTQLTTFGESPFDKFELTKLSD